MPGETRQESTTKEGIVTGCCTMTSGTAAPYSLIICALQSKTECRPKSDLSALQAAQATWLRVAMFVPPAVFRKPGCLHHFCYLSMPWSPNDVVRVPLIACGPHGYYVRLLRPAVTRKRYFLKEHDNFARRQPCSPPTSALPCRVRLAPSMALSTRLGVGRYHADSVSQLIVCSFSSFLQVF